MKDANQDDEKLQLALWTSNYLFVSFLGRLCSVIHVRHRGGGLNVSFGGSFLLFSPLSEAVTCLWSRSDCCSFCFGSCLQYGDGELF